TGFTAANGVTGGSGTASDPYIIAGWEINASASFYGIVIANTRAPFVIRDVFVHGGRGWQSQGISLDNVTSGQVVNSTVADTWQAIAASQAPGVAILNSTIGTNEDGISVYSSPGAT